MVTTAGHAAADPVQDAAWVCTPVVQDAERHAKPAAWSAFAGHVVLAPSHTSGRSQSPALARHERPLPPATWVQPVAGAQASVVQGFASLQFGARPPRHVPALHVSAVVHALPSWHAEPVSGLHEPVASQAWQSVVTPPPHAELQQYESTQRPVVHIRARVHAPVAVAGTHVLP